MMTNLDRNADLWIWDKGVASLQSRRPGLQLFKKLATPLWAQQMVKPNKKKYLTDVCLGLK